MAYSVVLDYGAIGDIQEAIDYYDEKQTGLGVRFEHFLNKDLIRLEKNPIFHIQYDMVRCLPLRKFPYMIHFTIDENNRLVIIWAVVHTARDLAIKVKGK